MFKFASALALAGYAAAYDATLSSCNTFAALFANTNGVFSCATATGSNSGTPMSGGWKNDESSGTTYTCANGSNGSNSWCVGDDASSASKSSSCSHNFK